MYFFSSYNITNVLSFVDEVVPPTPEKRPKNTQQTRPDVPRPVASIAPLPTGPAAVFDANADEITTMKEEYFETYTGMYLRVFCIRTWARCTVGPHASVSMLGCRASSATRPRCREFCWHLGPGPLLYQIDEAWCIYMYQHQKSKSCVKLSKTQCCMYLQQ